MRYIVKKYSDYILNILAFGTYIFSQQIVLLPFLGKNLNSTEFSNVIMFLTIFNVITIALGNELANVFIINKENKNIDQTYYKILFIINFVLFIVSMIISYYIEENFFLVFLTFLISNYKNFFIGVLRKNNEYNEVLKSNLLYFIGIVIGIYIYNYINSFVFPFLIGEALSSIFIINLRRKFNYKTEGRSPFNRKILNQFKDLSLVSFILNGLAYLDRFLILPILGANSMSIYYSASSMSKMLSLIANPINSVLLTKLSKNKNNEHKTTKIILVFSFFTIISIILSFISSYLGVLFLYPKYLKDTIRILLPIAISSGIGITVLLFKSVYIMRKGTYMLMTINVGYAFLLTITSLVLSSKYGIQGFAWANVISRISQLIIYFIYYGKGEKCEL